MPTIAFGDFLHLMMSELADTLDQSAAQAQVARVRIDDVELDIPAHLHLLKQEGAADSGARADGATPLSQLIVALPSPREVLPAGRAGRIRVRFEPDDARPSEGGAMTDISPATLALRAGDAIAQPVASSTANEEWQLAEFVDAVAAEVDRAEDTLALKARARGVTFALKQLNLELEVKVRRDPVGRIWFRTTNPDEASATVLKLDLTQMLPGQMQGGRRVQDLGGSARELTTLPGITAQEIARLNAIAIYSVDDLERYTQSGAMIAEVSRKSGIEDARLRRWLALPFIAEPKPPAGEPGSQVLIEGGNFGPALDPNASILYRGAPVTIVSWSDSSPARPRARAAPASSSSWRLGRTRFVSSSIRATPCPISIAPMAASCAPSPCRRGASCASATMR